MTFASLDLFTDTAAGPILIDAGALVKARDLPPLEPEGFLGMTSLGYRAARAQMPDWLAIRRREMTEDAISRAFKLSGKRVANPFLATQYEENEDLRRRALRGEDLRDAHVSTAQSRWAKFLDDYGALRSAHPELPDPRTFGDAAAEDLRKRVKELQAAGRLSTGLGDVGKFIGGMGAEIQHPINIATLPLGAPAALWSPARAGLIAALGQIAKVGGIEALIAAGAQIPIGLEKMGRLPDLGVPYGWSEFAEEVLGAAAGGFLLGGGLRGLVGLWRGLRDFRGRGGEDPVPAGTRLAAEDGLRVGERLLKDADANPFGAGGRAAHGEALARAYAAAPEGRPAELGDILRAEHQRQRALTPEERRIDAAEAAAARGEAPAREIPPPSPEALLARPYALPEGGDLRAPLAGRGGKLSTVREALDDVAPAWGDLRAAVARGDVDRFMDQTPALAQGIELLADAKRQGDSLAAAAARRAEAGRPPSLEAQLFAAALARDPLAEVAQPASRAAIATRLREFAEEARAVAPGSEFADPGAPIAILDRVVGLQREIARKIEAEAKDAPTPDAQRAATIADAKARLDQRDVAMPIGVDDEGKTIWKSARAMIEEAEASENAVAQIMTCAAGAAL